MKRSITFLLMMFIMQFSYVFSQGTNSETGLKWNGYLQTDNRVTLHGEGDLFWQEYRLGLKGEVNPVDKAHFYSEIWLRSFQFPTVQTSGDLQQKSKVSPLNLDFREAYMDIYGFINDNLDIRIGRQRIAWGTGDKLNPTDNLNSDELEDMWDFGRHIGSDAITATYYLNNYTLSAAYIPVFSPAVMPDGQWATALSSSPNLPSGFTLGNYEDSIILPEKNLKESSVAGFKLSSSFLNYDYSLSYVYGRDDFPVLSNIVLFATADPNIVDINSSLIYSRMHIAGFDFAGSVTDIGFWGETAVFFPEKVIAQTDLTAFGMGINESVTMDDEPFIKYVIGLDYTFTNGLYINGQYLHGFVHERGNDNLEDYFMFGVEKKIMNDKIKVIPISGGIEIKDLNDTEDNIGFIYSPEFYYYPVENAEILLGLRVIDGENTTMFGRIQDSDEFYLKLSYTF